MRLPVTRTPVQVRYSDTDALGHISNEAYVSYFAIGRLDFFHAVERLNGILLPSVVARLEIDYLAECFYGDALEVITRCTRVGTKSLTTAYDLRANGRTVARGQVVSVAFDPATRRPAPLPSGWEPSDPDAAP